MNMADPALEQPVQKDAPLGSPTMRTRLRPPASPISGIPHFGPFATPASAHANRRINWRKHLPVGLRLAIFSGALALINPAPAWSSPELSSDSSNSQRVGASMERTSRSGSAAVKAPEAPFGGKTTAPEGVTRAVIKKAAAPTVGNKPGIAPADVANLGPAQKVIKVSGLQLPPLSQPLPQWMQAASVRVDRIEAPRLPPTLPSAAPSHGTRLAQDPTAPPMRQPDEPVTNSDRLPNQIEVAVSTFVVLVTTSDLQTVAIADPTIADVAVVNSRSVLLNGKAPGVTSLVIADKNKIRQYSIRVTSAPGTRPVDVAAAIGLPGVSVRPLRDALILEGEVASAEESRRAVEIAGIYSPKVINQLTIRGSENADAGLAGQVKDLLSAYPNVQVKIAGDTVILTGTVDSPSQQSEVETIAKAAGKSLTVSNLTRLPLLTPDQVRAALGAVGSPAVTGNIAPGTMQPVQPLVVREAGGTVILEGSVESDAALATALDTAQRTGMPVINRAVVRQGITAEQTELSGIAAAIGMPGVKVSGTKKRLVLSGTVPDTNAAVAAEQIARAYASEVDNMLQTGKPVLVDVDISIVEITEGGLKNLGFQFPSLLDANNTGFVLGQRSINLDAPGPMGIGTTSNVATRGVDRSFGTQTAFQAALRAEVQDNNARLLSNPHTTVLSGRTATFQVGGQVPVPVSITQSATGTTTGIAFKDFGVLVDVVPNATLDGTVTMRLRTEVSQPDATIGFTPFAGASIIPGFTRRASVSEVTIQPNGTLAIGGLISRTNRKLVEKVPVLSKIPILGSLFTSKRYQNDMTDLVVFVTPKVLPNPLPEGTTAPAAVVAAGNTTNAGTTLGNPGIPGFTAFITGSGNGGGAQ